MTEQSPQTAEIQKYYKLLTTLIITGFYLASCTTDQDSPDSPDAVLTNNSPTSEVFDTADIVPTDSPPAVEVTNDDFSQANIQETVEATGTQVPTQTPEVIPTKEPAVPLPDLVTNLTATQKESFFKDLAEQLPILKENGSYHMFCVGDEIVTHEPAIQLPTGQEISHTFYCQYLDAEGNQQGFHIPVYTYNLGDLTGKNIGYLPKEYPQDVFEDLVITNKLYNYTVKSPGAIGMLERVGWSGPGHIFYVTFAMPTNIDDLSHLTERGYFNEAIMQMLTAAQIDQFAQTGDASLLPQTIDGEAILLLVNMSVVNAYGAMQVENK